MREEAATPPPVDRLIGALADRQHGVVGHAQLLELGLSKSAIGRRADKGQLHRIYRGVYAVGRRRIAREGWWMAAVLTAGPGAVLSHHSAAALWSVARPRERDEVSVPTTAGRRERKGLTIHRTSSLPKADTTTHDGIPTTTVPRTLLDLAEAATRRALERAADEAAFLRLFDERALRAVVAAHPGRVGAKRLARLLTEHDAGTTRTNEGLEEQFFMLCRDRRIPQPLVHAPIGPYEVDFLWPDARLVVETDDRASHERNSTFESDREREGYLLERGYRVRRFTWKKINGQPDDVARQVKALLTTSVGSAS